MESFRTCFNKGNRSADYTTVSLYSFMLCFICCYIIVVPLHCISICVILFPALLNMSYLVLVLVVEFCFALTVLIFMYSSLSEKDIPYTT